jgi:transcriptional regulator with XRE-family HTH domain
MEILKNSDRKPIRMEGPPNPAGTQRHMPELLMSETSKHQRRQDVGGSHKGTKSLQKSEIQANLKKFRKSLNSSQEEFGKVFGEYTRRQIHSYETGETEIPVALLLAVRDKGYPLEVILGPTEQVTLLTEIVGYLSHHMKIHASLKRLMDEASKSLEQEEKTLTNLLQRVNAVSEESDNALR